MRDVANTGHHRLVLGNARLRAVAVRYFDSTRSEMEGGQDSRIRSSMCKSEVGSGMSTSLTRGGTPVQTRERPTAVVLPDGEENGCSSLVAPVGFVHKGRILTAYPFLIHSLTDQ